MKTNVKKYVSFACLIVFSMFTFLLNFSFMPKEAAAKIELQMTMQKEKPAIDAIVDNVNFVDVGSNTYQITSLAGFNSFRNNVNAGTSYSGKTINLMCDINLNGTSFDPIAKTNTTKFKGIFDGQNHIIKNLKIHSDNVSGETGDIGLFCYIENATIKNLTITVHSITLTNAGTSAGCVVGSCAGTTYISNVVVLGSTMSGATSTIQTNTQANVSNVAGIIGYWGGTSGSISQCANFVTVNNRMTTEARAGGIIGCNVGTVSVIAAYNNASVSGTTAPRMFVGGICGYSTVNTMSISHSLNNGSISCSTAISYSYSYGNVNTGYIRQNVNELYVEYALKVDTATRTISNVYLGGIVGYAGGSSISNCINYGSFSAPDSYSEVVVKYFFGRYGDSSAGTEYTFHGDYITVSFIQRAYCFAEIAFKATASNCYSYDTTNSSSSYKVSGEYRKYYPKFHSLKNASADINLSNRSISSVFEDYPQDGEFYFKSTANSYGDKMWEPSHLFMIQRRTYTNCIYNGYSASMPFQINYSSKNAYQAASAHLLNPYYNNTSNLIKAYESSSYFSNSTSTSKSYTSSINSTFVSDSNSNEHAKRYRSQGKTIIEANSIARTLSGTTYTITHNFKYDHKNNTWNNNNNWTNNEAHSKTLATVTQLGAYGSPVAFTAKTDDTFKTTSLSSSYWANTSTISSGKPHLKWLYWNDNYNGNPFGGDSSSSGSGGSSSSGGGSLITPGLPGGGKDIVQKY